MTTSYVGKQDNIVVLRCHGGYSMAAFVDKWRLKRRLRNGWQIVSSSYVGGDITEYILKKTS